MRQTARALLFALSAATAVTSAAEPALAGRPAPRGANAVVARLTRAAFRTIARVTKGRVFHHPGVLTSGRMRLEAGNPFGLPAGSMVDVEVRLSRATRKRQPKEVPLGVIVRVIKPSGAFEDLPVVSADGGKLKNVPGFFGVTRYASLVPFETGGSRRVLLLAAEPGTGDAAARAAGTDLGEVPAAVAAGRASFQLATGPHKKDGAPRPIGRIVLDRVLSHEASEAFEMNPWRHNDDVVPAGWINNVLRRAAVEGSQEGRRALRLRGRTRAE